MQKKKNDNLTIFCDKYTIEGRGYSCCLRYQQIVDTFSDSKTGMGEKRDILADLHTISSYFGNPSN